MKSIAFTLPLLALCTSHVAAKGDCHGSAQKHKLLARTAMVKRSIPRGSRPLQARSVVRRAVAEDTSVTSSAVNTTTLYNSTALYFYSSGQPGACKKVNTDNDLVVGLPLSLYGDLAVTSPLCGAKVFIQDFASGKNVTAIVADTSGNNYTTLSVAAFSALAPLELGMLDIQFHFVNSSLVVPSSSPSVQVAAPTPQQVQATPASAEEPATSSSPIYTLPAAAKPTPNTPFPTVAAKQNQDDAAAKAEASKSAAAAAAASSSSKAAADAAWASSSKAAAAAATQAPSSSSSTSNSGGQTYTGGFATYFYQNGVAGNCGTVAQESDKVIALPTAMYAGGSHCGQQIRITRTDNGNSVVATVRDSCPTCVNNESLDLSVGAFTAIASESEGMVPISWSWA